MDRISHLPEPLIQHILSYLNSKESARAGFLSRSLLNAWSTRPILDFDIAYLNHNFRKLVLRYLQFYHKERLALQKFRLHIQGPKDEEDRQRVFETAQNWLFSVIKLALSNGIVELDLSANYFGLPFQHKDLEWCNLQKLKLKYIPIDNHTLSYMISSCPLLTHLHLEGCPGLNKSLTLKIPNLREFSFICIGNHSMQEVDLRAPKLESFKSTCIGVVRIDESTSLKSLSLSNSTMGQVRLQGLLSSYRFLEDLSLTFCFEIKTLVVSSHSIKFLRLSECHYLDNIEIDAPNLQLLEYYSSYGRNSLPFVISRAAKKVKCCRVTYWCTNGSALSSSLALRQLMTMFQSSTLTVRSHSYKRPPRKLLQPIDEHHLESLKLEYWSINEAEIEGFLQICRPKNFICDYHVDYNNHMIMRKLCDDLWKINECAGENLQYGGCGSGFDCRCWRHYIEEARIFYVVGIGNEQKPLTNYEMIILSTESMRTSIKISVALDWKQAPNLS